jgi:hypothetical protein
MLILQGIMLIIILVEEVNLKNIKNQENLKKQKKIKNKLRILFNLI